MRLIAATALLLAFSIAASAQQPAAGQQLKDLYDAEWAFRLREFARTDEDGPWESSGDHLPGVAPADQARRAAFWQRTLAQVNAIPEAQLSAEDRINLAVFRTVLEAEVANQKFRVFEMPFNSDSSFWSELDASSPFRTPEQYRRYLGRMRDVPRYFDEQTANMRAGLVRGFSVPRVTLTGRDAGIAAYTVADPERNPFYKPFETLPSTMPAAEQQRLRAEARAVIAQQVVPAYTKLLAFFRDEYLPKTRTTLAAEAMPDGKAFYQAWIREFTTLPLTAEQIHAIGLKEVARIEAEMEQVKQRAGFRGTLAQFITFLRTDPQFVARTPDELMGVSAYVAKRADGQLKNNFGVLPRYRFAIVPVPDAIAPFYTGGRGGLESCMMNTYDLPSRPLYNIPALTLHECVPGHSFQAALALEGPDRPKFRGQTYFSGYGEGWGLYTEWLGTKMGIYRTPYEDFGRLSYEMWRAARLVIDTGIHHYGWSREKAVEYLAGHTALSNREVGTEIDRYISWPAQALAYKLGEMTIRRKRADAEQALGGKFDPRWFHDTILGLGSVPLPVLEAELDRWIKAGGSNPNATKG